MRGQWLADIAIQEYGNLEAAMEIALANGISLTELLAPEQDLLLPELEKQTKVVSYYRAKKVRPATELAYSPAQEGIEFWAIEIDFVTG
jgi:hypothetical protein